LKQGKRSSSCPGFAITWKGRTDVLGFSSLKKGECGKNAVWGSQPDSGQALVEKKGGVTRKSLGVLWFYRITLKQVQGC